MIESVENGDERIDRLLDELAAYGVIDAGAGNEVGTGANTETGGTVEARTENNDAESGKLTVSARAANGSKTAVDAVFADVGADFDFDDAIVKENLEAILLVLISIRGGAHGKRLMGDLSDVFDAQLSPGTVYPRLHDLEAAGVLSVHELVRTKEYTITDEERAHERIERAMCQHLALGAVFRSSLERA